MELLKTLCQIHAPSGSEAPLTEFLLDFIKKNSGNWKVKPEVFAGKGFQDCIVLVFGKPRTAVFAHIDSIGFTVRYGKELVKIGGPRFATGYKLVGEDSKGKIECTLHVDAEHNNALSYEFERDIETGTTLTFKPEWKETQEFVQCCYMDNRLGVWNALELAKTLENGIIAFSCWEEHAGGSVEYLARFIYEKYDVAQGLISDITWVTDGVPHNKGVVISLRDSGIPRKSYVDRIRKIAAESGIPFQVEVECTGGSDGNALQRSPYPFDWCFIGAPEDNVHSPEEIVSKKDIESMVAMYKVLMDKL
jgi:putative aminopeptidase FrvX